MQGSWSDHAQIVLLLAAAFDGFFVQILNLHFLSFCLCSAPVSGSLSQWPTFKLLGVTYLIGKKINFYFMVLWLREEWPFAYSIRKFFLWLLGSFPSETSAPALSGHHWDKRLNLHCTIIINHILAYYLPRPGV